MVAARLVTTKKGDNQFTEDRSIDLSTQSDAASLLTVSKPSVQRAQALLATKDTDAISAVDAGNLRVSKALNQVKEIKYIN